MEWKRVHLPPPVTMSQLKKLAKGDKRAAKRSMEYFNRCEHWINETHHVAIDRKSGTIGDGTTVIHLSIKRHDREPISDWRVMQDIKTSLLGPDHEAMELYPAESRVVDLANQYHLWCILEELANTTVHIGEKSGRLLDEIDYVNGVSGGSFTASYFALFGDRIFVDFEQRFLKRNVQADLLLKLLWPWNWVRLISPFYDRTDLAIDYYHDQVFDGATFHDLYKRNGPTLTISATDLSTGNPFRFTQEQFNFICSDLSSFPIARAVGASSAIPILFQPVLLHNYSGTCGFERPPWLQRALKKSRTLSVRRWRGARIMDSYLDGEQRPYVHLIDGGISDNLALRDPIDQASDVTPSTQPWTMLTVRALPWVRFKTASSLLLPLCRPHPSPCLPPVAASWILTSPQKLRT